MSGGVQWSRGPRPGVERYPEVVRKEVLTRLDPTDLAMLLRVSRACRAAVVRPGGCCSPRPRHVS